MSKPILLTLTRLDGKFTQNWIVEDSSELWRFLNKHAKMQSGSVFKETKRTFSVSDCDSSAT